MAKKKQKTPTKATADRSVLRVSTLLARDAFITETITITLKYITRAKHNPISMKMIKDCLINLVLIIILLNCLRWHHLIFCIASLAIDRITSMSISSTRPCMRDLLNCSIKVLFGPSLCQHLFYFKRIVMHSMDKHRLLLTFTVIPLDILVLTYLLRSERMVVSSMFTVLGFTVSDDGIYMLFG